MSEAAERAAAEVGLLARGLVELELAYEHQVVGCADDEVAAVLESANGFALPEEYVAFLRKMGREAGRLLIGTVLYYPDVVGVPGRAARFAAEDAPQLRLTGRHFFAAHQGYQFYFFERERPGAVFLHTEGDDGPTLSSGSFLDWLWAHAKAEARLGSREVFGDRFPS